ncbi:VRR-NUC domain-containing protein [Pseudomonas mohnii]
MKPVAVQSPTQQRARAPRLDREGLEQAALISELRARMPKVADLIYHVPNGGHRHKSVAGKLKQQGVVAGIPDLVLTMARGGYFGLYIEFKATPPNDADVSAAQHERIRKLNEQGYLAIVCRGHFEAVEAIRDYLRLSPTVVVIQ